MKNYFARFGLPSDASMDDVEQRLTERRDETNDSLSLAEGQSVLLDDLTVTHYNRLHHQYQAMALAAGCLEHAEARNTHRWLERFVEYPADNESLENL